MRRVMILTGASSGIGRALALAAAQDTFDLVISARRADRLQQVAEQVQNAGGSVAIVVGEITDPQVPQRLVETAVERFGRIDVIVHNAGAGQPGPLLTQTDEAIERQWAMHVLAPLRTSRAALPYLRKTHGQLMFVGSGLARVPLPNGGAYAMVKAAIRAAAIQLRHELRQDHIAVTYIDPGLVKTEFSKAAGMHGESQRFAGDVDMVARRILRATHTRPARINAIPLHTLAAILGEWFPKAGEWAMRNALARKKNADRAKAQASAQTDQTALSTASSGSAAAAHAARAQSETLVDATTTIAREESTGVPALDKRSVVDVSPTAAVVPHVLESPAEPSGTAQGDIVSTGSVPEIRPASAGKAAFAKALEPVAHRMERIKMPRDFVRDLLKSNAEIKLQDAAMQWAGMPNKNERAAMQEVLQALTAAGFLRATGDETWTVIHPPE